MIEIVVFAIIIAKLKNFEIRHLFFNWCFYPILVSQCVLIFFQISVFAGNYYFIQFAQVIKIVVMLSFIFPLIVFQLYKPAFIGSVFVFLGTLLNKFAMAQNNGKMPVFPSLSYSTGYVKAEMFDKVDSIHVLGDATVSWRFLTDYIDLGYSILSPGDILIHIFSFIMLYNTIKAVNMQYQAKSIAI